MKTLKFKEHLSKLIINGSKNTTLRLFDDKDLSSGEIVSFLVSETSHEFTKAQLLEVTTTTLGNLTTKDLEGHEPYTSSEEMHNTLSNYYNCPVDNNSPVKIIKFKLIYS